MLKINKKKKEKKKVGATWERFLRSFSPPPPPKKSRINLDKWGHIKNNESEFIIRTIN
jgi:hypothetical protein